MDSTSVLITTGQAFKDDILLEITADKNIDFTDADYYLTATPFNEAGTYYVVLEYIYAKSNYTKACNDTQI